MGNSVSRVVGCFIPVAHDHQRVGAVFFSEPFDEGLGHSFCYIRPSLESPHLSPSHSHRYAATVLPSADLDARSSSFRSVTTIDRNPAETAAFKSISGASVSANASALHTILSHDQFHSFTKVPDDRHAAFESTASFTCLPLQPVPRGFTFSGPISATTFSGPMSGPLQVRNFMLGPVEQQQRGLMSAPLERGFMSGPLERGLVSVPLERGFMSGPLERGCMSGSIDTTTSDRSHFSAPLGEPYHYRRMTRRRRSISRLFSLVGKPVKGALTRNISSTLSRTHKSIVTPIRQFVWHRLHNGAKEAAILYDSPSELRYVSSDADPRDNHSLQWAQGKAGEDRVHVVLSADHGWLFVGIYDGFNGPDAPDFLMRNLYRAVNRELQGLLWDNKEGSDQCKLSNENDESGSHVVIRSPENDESNVYTQRAESDSIQFEVCSLRPDKNDDLVHTYTLKEYLDGDFTRGAGSKDESVGMQEPPMPQPVIKGKNMDASPQIATNFENFQQEGLTCNHSIDGRSATGSQADGGADERAGDSRSGTEEAVGPEDVKFKNNSIDMDINHSRPDRVSTVWSGKSFMRLSFRHRQIKNKESHRKFLPRRYDSLNKRKESEKDDLKEGEFNPWRQGAVDHDAVLRALARALEVTEEAYLNMADHVLEENPELALMGSCILVALMKDKDLYVLNVGDSRAIVAQQRSYEHLPLSSSNADNAERSRARDAATQLDLEHFSEESSMATEASRVTSGLGPPASSTSLNTLQLSMDHNTSIEEEIRRIKAEHPDDNMCILNGRVKGRLKVTRAFGAGFLKKPRWNNAILKMFQIDYVGSAPYVSCAPALHHHRLGPSDRFLILSSDGLYQYFSNQEAVSHVEWFMEKYPEGDPAQHLIEELLFRAAKKAGMDFHELLDIPQGERRKYHDDVSVMVISLEGRIWRSSG